MVQTKMAVKSIEDEMLDRIGKEIARDIDEGIMSDILIESGWTPVNFQFNSNEQAVDITDWLNETCESKWRRFGGNYLFEDKKEAEWFTLRWT